MTPGPRIAPTTPSSIRRGEEILAEIRRVVAERGYPPSVRELALALGVAPATVQVNLLRLHQLGRIRKDPHRPRAIAIVE